MLKLNYLRNGNNEARKSLYTNRLQKHVQFTYRRTLVDSILETVHVHVYFNRLFNLSVVNMAALKKIAKDPEFCHMLFSYSSEDVISLTSLICLL